MCSCDGTGTNRMRLAPDRASILLITDVLQQTNRFIYFFLHCINIHVVEIDSTGVLQINQLALIKNWRIT